jgi:hypothetical protein
MKLLSLQKIHATFTNANITQFTIDNIRKSYVNKIKNRIVQVYIICYLYEQARGA